MYIQKLLTLSYNSIIHAASGKSIQLTTSFDKAQETYRIWWHKRHIAILESISGGHLKEKKKNNCSVSKDVMFTASNQCITKAFDSRKHYCI